MKKYVAFFAIIGLVMGFTSCFQNCRAMDNGPVINSQRQVSAFEKIEVSVPYDIFYTQGDKCSVKIKGPEKLVKRVTTKSDGTTLSVYIPTRESFHFGEDSDEVQVFITSPDVTYLVLKGSGTLKVRGRIDSDTLNLRLLGSGDMQIPDIVCDKLVTYLQGSGDLTVKKVQADISRVKLWGSGDIQVTQHNVRTTDIDLTGSGDVKVRMKGCKSVSCKLIGSGDVELSGDVTTLHQSVTGSGDIDVSELKVGR